MKTKIRDGEKITVFDDVEEMKWFFHTRLCKDSSDFEATWVMMYLDMTDLPVEKRLQFIRNYFFLSKYELEEGVTWV